MRWATEQTLIWHSLCPRHLQVHSHSPLCNNIVHCGCNTLGDIALPELTRWSRSTSQTLWLDRRKALCPQLVSGRRGGQSRVNRVRWSSVRFKKCPEGPRSRNWQAARRAAPLTWIRKGTVHWKIVSRKQDLSEVFEDMYEATSTPTCFFFLMRG